MSTLKRALLTTGLLGMLLSPAVAKAFPEMVRHNYPNCTSCHVSPNGGGILNAYGRQSSAAVLSTWGGENEALPFYGVVSQPDWIDTAAFGRAVQTYQENSRIRSGYFWWMQAELEAAARFGADRRWTADLSLGVSPDVLNGLLRDGDSPLSSHRHYVMYRPSDPVSLRAGKFLIDYGIYLPEHNVPTRQGIGFDEGSETYNVELGYQGDRWSGALTADLGRPDDSSLLREKGIALTAAYAFSDHLKAGGSAYYGTQNGHSRELAGLHGLLGFTPSIYALVEGDFQFDQPVGTDANQGLFTYVRWGWEAITGLHLYLTHQVALHSFTGGYTPLAQNLKYGATPNRIQGVGPGVYWFPRPHFYFQAELQRQFSVELPSPQNYGYVTVNLYL